MDWLNTEVRTPNDYQSQFWRWLNQASKSWTQVSPHEFTDAQSTAFARLVLGGQFQVRQRFTARGGAGEPQVQLTCIVTGDYKRALLQAVRGAVPEFESKVVIHPADTVEYRLSAAGLAAQAENRLFDGGDIEENFMAASLRFAIPGVVNITNIEHLPAEAAKTEPPGADPQPSSSVPKPRKVPAWPVVKTEGHVAAYHAARKSQYLTLGRDVLDDRPGAAQAFCQTFGPKAIADAITKQVGTTVHRACRAQDVHKTHTYRNLIQPLIQPKPRKPADWDEMIEGRVGDDLPEILEDIPFEDDDC